MHRQHEARAGDHLFDRGLLVALADPVIAGDARLHVADFVEGFDELIVDVVEHVAANGGHAFRGFHDHVHRTFGVAAGGLANDAGHQLGRPGYFKVEKAQRALGMQPVDQMLDVDRRILRMHQA